MSCRHKHWYRSVLGLWLAFTCHGALAQTIVTACGTDVAAGGVNLKTALAAGGSIIIRCVSGSTTIALTQTHALRRSTTLDGEGRVTLDAANQRSMFLVADASVRLVLRRLTLQRGLNPAPIVPGSGQPKGGIVSSRGAVEMWTVRTLRTLEPYDVRSLLAVENSTFEDNTGSFVVRAIEATFVNTVFANNRGTPLTYPLQRNDQRPRASFERSEVFGNLAPIRWFGDLSIRHTNFVNNGTPQTVGGALNILDGIVNIERSDFTNNHALIGGAIHTSGGRLEVRRGTFEGNRAQQRGGAISVRSGSTGFIEVVLGYLKFRSNQAKDGGAIDLEGHLLGGPLLFADNSASGFGGAMYLPRGRAELSRAVFVGNRAGIAGGAIRSGPTGLDRLHLGNALIARNVAPVGGGFSGRTLQLTNASVVENQGGGVEIVALAGPPSPAGGLQLINTLLVNNGGGNCIAAAGAIADGGQNLQFPGSDCGIGVGLIDPDLDSMYVPAPDSAARGAGDAKVCLEDQLIRARDVYGSERPTYIPCAIGAVERNLEHHAVRLLSKRRELPLAAVQFLEFLGVKRRARPATSDPG